MMSKQEQYAALVRGRKQCSACSPALLNPSRSAGGQYDSDEIGPWSRWQGNLDAQVMIVGQDFGDVRYFEHNRGLDADGNPTNKRLLELLASIDIGPIAPSSQPAGRGGRVFLTNAILCLKQGGLQGAVRADWFANCGTRFLRRQIEIVAPKVVVCLGERAYRAVLAAFGHKPQPFRVAVEAAEGVRLTERTVALAVYHCGARVLNRYRKFPQQQCDWQRVRVALGR